MEYPPVSSNVATWDIPQMIVPQIVSGYLLIGFVPILWLIPSSHHFFNHLYMTLFKPHRIVGVKSTSIDFWILYPGRHMARNAALP